MPEDWGWGPKKAIAHMAEIGFSVRKMSKDLKVREKLIREILESKEMQNYLSERRKNFYTRTKATAQRLLSLVERQVTEGVWEHSGKYVRGKFVPQYAKRRELSVKELEAISKIGGLIRQPVTPAEENETNEENKNIRLLINSLEKKNKKTA